MKSRAMGLERAKGSVLRVGVLLLVLLVLPYVQGGAPLGLHEAGVGRQLHAECDATTFGALSPSFLDSKAVGMEWVGVDDQYVFAISQRSQIWRSKDGGSSFEDITPRFNESIKGAEPVVLVNIIPSTANPADILFVGWGSMMWTSHDYGETLTPHATDGKWHGSRAQLRPHPLKDGWVLAMAKRPDCKPLDEYEMQCPNDLFLTKNAFSGLTWVNLTANAKGIAGFVDFDWSQALCKHMDCTPLKLPDESILATMYQHPGDWDVAWDPDVHFIRSDDLFKTQKNMIRCGNQFEIVGKGIYLALANSCPTDVDGKARKPDPQWPQGITLYTSDDAAASFVQACLPVAVRQEGYELLETHDGAGTIAIVDYVVKTPYAEIPASSVYTAGPHDALFSLNIPHVNRQDASSVSSDFARVEGLPGVFISNQLVPRRDGEDELSQLVESPLVLTKISFNGGGHWQAIPAPVGKFVHPRCDRCNGQTNCHLHLHGSSSWYYGVIQYPAVYSHVSAPGLVMASGNTAEQGQGLDENDGLCTWLSTDGGASWIDVAEGAYIYEFADWGGVIFMAKHEMTGPSDEIRFSLDYGRCWNSVPLATAMLVENIRIEPDGQRPKVLVHGRACRKHQNLKCGLEEADKTSQVQGLVYAVDVSKLMGTKMAACTATDFDQWTVPSELHQPQCLLGQTMQFTRRRQGVTCLQGGDYKRPAAINTTCDCNSGDVECDYGFVRSGDGACVALPAEKMPQCPVVQSGMYKVSKSGLRLLHSDVCKGVDKVISDTDGKGKAPGQGTQPGGKPQPPSPKGGGGHHGHLLGLFMFFIVAGGLSALAFAWWTFLASEDAKATLRDLCGPVTATLSAAAAWAYDSCCCCLPNHHRAPVADIDAELNYFPLSPDGGALGGAGAGGGGGLYNI